MERPGGSQWSHWLDCSHYLLLSLKGEFFRLSEGSLWFEWLSLPCLVVFGFLAPTTVSLIVRTADGRTDGTGVFTFPYCFFEKTRDFFFILMSLVIRGNDFNFFYCNNKPKIELVGRKLTQKSTLFARLASVIWPFWGSKKSFSRLFQSFFWSYLGSYWVWFSTLKGLLLGVFSALKVDK